MGSNNNEKWLRELKERVQNHSEQLPDSFWEDLQKEMPLSTPSEKGNGAVKLLWTIPAAAVLVLALLLWQGDRVPEEAVPEKVMLAESTFVEENGTAAFEEEVAAEREDVAVEERFVGKSGNPVQEVNRKVEDVMPVIETVAEEEDTAVYEDVAEADSAEVKTAVHENNVEQGKRGEETDRDKAREELLKELEYLQQDGWKAEKKKGKGTRRWLAFVAGNSGMKMPDWGKDMSSMVADNGLDMGFQGSNQVGTGPDGQQGVAGEHGNLNGFLIMDSRSDNSVQWIGNNTPSAFTARNCNYRHSEPVRAGLEFAVGLYRNIYVGSGLSYQYLKSEITGNKKTVQNLHYLGVPLEIVYRFVDTRVFSAYVSGGYLIEKCVYGEHVEHTAGNEVRRTVIRLPKRQNSLNASVGAQLNLSRSAALYVEPGVYHYIGMREEVIAEQNGYRIKNIYSEEPSGFSIGGGLRFSF